MDIKLLWDVLKRSFKRISSNEYQCTHRFKKLMDLDLKEPWTDCWLGICIKIRQ